APRTLRVADRDERVLGALPGADLPPARDHLRAIGVVEPEHRSLRGHIRGAEAGRVQRVALDLRRASLVALDDEAEAEAAQRHRGREVERSPEDDGFGLLHIRDDVLLGLLRARAEARDRQRRAHQVQELAASGPGLADTGRLAWELILEELEKLLASRQLLETPPQLRPLLGGQAAADRGEIDGRGRT